MSKHQSFFQTKAELEQNQRIISLIQTLLPFKHILCILFNHAAEQSAIILIANMLSTAFIKTCFLGKKLHTFYRKKMILF